MGMGMTEGKVGVYVCVCSCVCRGVGVAAEVISQGVWLDHIPLPVFSCCGWGFVVGLAGRKGGDGETERERKRKRGGGSRNGYGEIRVEGVERWAVPTVLTKTAPALRP